MTRGFDEVDLSVTEGASFVAVFAPGLPVETCVRDAAFTETFGLDVVDEGSVEAVFFAVTGGLSLLVARTAAVAYERRHVAETKTRDE